MPIAIINILEGRDDEKKRRLIENVSRAISESIDAPLETVRVLVQEYPLALWGIGGQSVADKRAGMVQNSGQKSGGAA